MKVLLNHLKRVCENLFTRIDSKNSLKTLKKLPLAFLLRYLSPKG